MSWTHHRSRLAVLSRTRPADDPEIIEHRRAMKAELLAEHIRKVVDSAPPLSTEQRGQIAAILRGAA